MVGTVEMRKGHRLALEAFEALWGEGIDAELVIAGRPGWGVEQLIDGCARIPRLDGACIGTKTSATTTSSISTPTPMH